MIPAALKISAPEKASPYKISVIGEAYLYPLGCVWALTCRLHGVFDISEISSMVHGLIRDKIFWSPSLSGQFPTLESSRLLSDNILEILEWHILGDRLIRTENIRFEPFSIVTFVKRASGIPDSFDPRGNSVHRLLEAVTSWSPTWANDRLPVLNERILETRSSGPPGDLVYGGRRGRAVWFPTSFNAGHRNSSLNCYHRNLTHAIAHTEMLCGFCQLLSRKREQNEPFSPYEQDCSKRVAGILGRLYGGKDKKTTTYRTSSTAKYIRDNDFIEPVNAIRRYWGMSDLG